MPSRLTALALSLLLAAPAAPAFAQSMLSGLDGTWTGRGEARNPPTSSAARAFCRVDVNEQAADQQWRVSGRCSDGQGTSSVSIDIRRQGGDRVAGTVRSGASGEALNYSGTINGNRIDMQSTSTLNISGEPYSSNLTLARQSNGFALVNDLRNLQSGQQIRSTSILFQPEG